MLGIPMCMLPRCVSNSEVYGAVKPGIPGLEALSGVPVCGAAGDQQAALFGQTCFHAGDAKNTYGTGCFTLMNVGGRAVRSRAGLVTSVAWSVNDAVTYALEGSVFNGGSTIQWLRDELHLIDSAPECDRLAESVDSSGGVIVVLNCGMWSSLEELSALRRSDRVFTPQRVQAECDDAYRMWKRAVQRAGDWIEH